MQTWLCVYQYIFKISHGTLIVCNHEASSQCRYKSLFFFNQSDTWNIRQKKLSISTTLVFRPKKIEVTPWSLSPRSANHFLVKKSTSEAESEPLIYATHIVRWNPGNGSSARPYCIYFWKMCTAVCRPNLTCQNFSEVNSISE